MTVRLYTSRSQQTTLTSAVTSGGTSINVANASTLFATVSGASISSTATFTIVLDPDTALEEIVEVTGASSNTLTITRSIDAVGTATDHSAGAVVRHMVIGRDLRESNTHIESTGQVHGLAATGGVVVGTSEVQTLTNKTLTTPVVAGATLSGTITSTATISGGTLTGAIVTGLTSSGMADSQATPKNYVDAILGSATAASSSATAAATSANSAANSATASASSASAASTSASSASVSQIAAASSAVTASNSASAATTSASSAATSASAAATSANSASASATAASTSANSAAASASAASTSANSASASATAASTSASSAATSAASSAASTSAAATSAASAATSATSAANSATAASTSANSAATSATSSANSATASASSATAAATSAASAAASVSAVATSATSASNSASAAATSATSAATSATSAATSATSSASSASLASEWAIKTDGTVDGTNYSAKYWALNANPSSNIGDADYTAKGVILVGTGTGAWTQLTVASTADYVLAVDSGQTTGVKWQTPPVLKSGATMTGELFLSTSLPTTSLSAVSKSYVDGLVEGLAWKEAVNLLADSNVALTGTSGTLVIDGHSALDNTDNGYRILLKNQTTSADKGIYTYSDDGTNYTLARSTDADVYTELIGASVYIQEGTTYGKTSWVQSNHYITSFSGQVWTQTSGPGTYTGVSPIAVTGTEISLNTSGVTASSYPAATITVDAYGRVTSASSSDLSAYADTILTLMGAY